MSILFIRTSMIARMIWPQRCTNAIAFLCAICPEYRRWMHDAFRNPCFFAKLRVDPKVIQILLWLLRPKCHIQSTDKTLQEKKWLNLPASWKMWVDATHVVHHDKRAQLPFAIHLITIFWGGQNHIYLMKSFADVLTPFRAIQLPTANVCFLAVGRHCFGVLSECGAIIDDETHWSLLVSLRQL